MVPVHPQQLKAYGQAGPEPGLGQGRGYATTGNVAERQPEPWLQTASDKRRAVERELACFTPAQQRAIAIICGQWWEARLEAINVGEVEELRDKLDYVMEQTGIKPKAAQIALWKAQRSRQVTGARG